MLFKIFGIVVTIILGAIIGLNISKNIENSVLYGLFWLLYIITYLTISNVIAISLFYNVLRKKTGPPGTRGPPGESGPVGEMGICRTGCQESECNKRLTDTFINEINRLAGNPTPPIKLQNLFIKQQIKQICTSPQYKKSIDIKGAESVINYLSGIWKEWARLIYKSSGRTFVESVGGDDLYKWKGENPFNEIEKYDIYYWKTNKLFKPIGIDVCDDGAVNRGLPQPEKPRLYIMKSNKYYWIYDDRGSGAHNDFSIYRPSTGYNRKTKLHYYPMGDIGVYRRHHEHYKGKHREQDGVKVPNDNLGPKKPTMLVAGDVKPPIDFEYRWDDSGSGGEFDGSSWRPIPPPGYRCLGDMMTRSHGPPSKNSIRCVPKECTEKVSNTFHNGQYMWRDSGSGAEQDAGIYIVPGGQPNGLGNERSFDNYNLMRATRGFTGSHDGFWKIKDECLKPTTPTKKPVDNGDWISHRWNGYPERDPKYSIFTFLGLVPEGIIQNIETRHKYQFISSQREPNNYFIKYFHKTKREYGNLESQGNTKAIVNMTTNRDKIQQMWILEYTDINNVLIKSKATGKYLGLHYFDNWKLNILLYDKPTGNRTKWRIRSTSTGSKDIKQKK